ncbi:MAG: LysR family transcriptional regulator [Methylococcales bacterium]|nr:LysR family transcriptional regulator [Methylococcales bacterium]
MKTAITLDALIVLDAIAQRGSFAAAAKALHRVPSSITYAISKLEQSLEVNLFDRKGHKAHLTPAGEALLQEGRNLLQLTDHVERNIKRIATGWEAEIRIAVGDVIPYDKVLQLCDDFYQVAPETHLSLTTEVLGGAWDALASGRADFAIGAPGDSPPGGGYASHPLKEPSVDFVFAISPQHPLASAKEPIANNLIRQHRAVAAADSSRLLQPRTVGLLSGQSVLTVPDLSVKRLAHIKGLGIGYLPLHLIEQDLAEGTLVTKITEDGANHSHGLYYAWQTKHLGNGMTWLINHLCHEEAMNWFS